VISSAVVAALALAVGAQSPPPGAPASGTAATTSPAGSKNFKTEEIEQVVAPIALYTDSVLSQVLMAATYPVEVVMAQRWAKDNKALKGDALTKQLEAQSWDPSVKSLINFPDTLNMMSEKLDWTIKLGDAFIGQQKEVLDAVQRLRAKAKANGNLESNEQQKVTASAPVATTQSVTTTQIITIEPANPQTVYVPTYNPQYVYGGWPYPSYPPYYYYPPSYPVGSRAVWFGAGLAVGAAWGYAWGNCNWGHGDVDIDVNRNTNINTNIDRSKAKANIEARQTNRTGSGTTGRTSFQHDPSHRRGVTYRDNATAAKFGGVSNNKAVQSRDAYRGHANAGRADLAKGGVTAPRPNMQPMGSGSAANRPANTANRPANTANRPATPSQRPAPTQSRSSALSGSGSSARATASASNRGSVSRSSGGGSRSSPARGGGGGASRGGGGARGGGGRR
jgi:hypothetical protein